MEHNASGSLLTQYVAGDTSAAQAFQSNAKINTEVTRIVICNTSGSAVNASLFHDDSGTGTFTTATALIYTKSIPANDYLTIETNGPNGGFHVQKSGQIGFQDASGGDLTLSLYGITQPVDGSATRK